MAFAPGGTPSARADTSSSDAHRLRYRMGERFILEAPLIAPLVPPGMTVVDVGANIGYYLLLFERLRQRDLMDDVPAFVKIDVEGYEGAVRTRSFRRQRIVQRPVAAERLARSEGTFWLICRP